MLFKLKKIINSYVLFVKILIACGFVHVAKHDPHIHHDRDVRSRKHEYHIVPIN